MAIPGNPHSIAIAAVIALAASAAALATLIPLARRIGLVDRPGGRKRHRGAVPLVGGLSILSGLLASVLWLDGLHPFGRWLLATLTALVLIGAMDDRLNLGVRRRVLMQSALILTMMLVTGTHVHQLGSLFGLDAQLGWFGVPFTLVSMIGLLNAFNLVDGIDGLASVMALVAIGAILYTTRGMIGGRTGLMLVLLALALLPQLACNLGLCGARGKVFLGDAGSTLLGYVIGWVLIRDSQTPGSGLSPVGTLWCVAIPVLDTLAVMVRRMRLHLSPFKPDRRHIHYLLTDGGLGPRQTLAVIGAAAVGIWSIGAIVRALDLGAGSNLLAFGVVLVAYVYATARLNAWVAAGGRFRTGSAAAREAPVGSLVSPLQSTARGDAMQAVRVNVERDGKKR